VDPVARVPLEGPPHRKFFPAGVAPWPAEGSGVDGLVPATAEVAHDGGGGGGDTAKGVVSAAAVLARPVRAPGRRPPVLSARGAVTALVRGDRVVCSLTSTPPPPTSSPTSRLT
jgi:hypothetical protein